MIVCNLQQLCQQTIESFVFDFVQKRSGSRRLPVLRCCVVTHKYGAAALLPSISCARHDSRGTAAATKKSLSEAAGDLGLGSRGLTRIRAGAAASAVVVSGAMQQRGSSERLSSYSAVHGNGHGTGNWDSWCCRVSPHCLFSPWCTAAFRLPGSFLLPLPCTAVAITCQGGTRLVLTSIIST